MVKDTEERKALISLKRGIRTRLLLLRSVGGGMDRNMASKSASSPEPTQ